MTGEIIRSRDNAQVKAARQLLEAKARRARGRLLVEGARLLRDAWQAGYRPDVCFYDAAALGVSSPGAVLLAECKAAGIPCLECTSAVFATLAETVTPQGIAAVLPLPRIVPSAPADLSLVLDGVRDPGNVGTLLRTAEAAGVQQVILGPGCVDAFSPKVMRSGMGAHFRLAIVECATWKAVRNQLPDGATCYVAAAQAEMAYDAVDWTRPSALVVGGEATGASEAAFGAATPVAIPMQGRVESLNAAMAGAIILFEAARQRRARR